MYGDYKEVLNLFYKCKVKMQGGFNLCYIYVPSIRRISLTGTIGGLGIGNMLTISFFTSVIIFLNKDS